MPWHFIEPEPPTIENHLCAIAAISTRAADFWKAAHGWAPDDAADALSRARLDWLASFSRTLKMRVQEVTEHPQEPAAVILAWAHLRTLVEGHLKLFLTVFLMDYRADARAPKSHKTGNILEPSKLTFEDIRQFLTKRDLLTAHHAFIETVQQRGNAIHAFADNPIGTPSEFLDHVEQYRKFLTDLESSLPNPYEENMR
jgi:hypothetical protein